MAGDVSSLVEDAIERDDWTEVARILSECSCRDSDSVMTQLVSRDQWDAVKQVIRCLSDDQLESALTVLVTQRQWKAAGLILKRGVSNIQRRWAHEQCIQHGRADDFQHFLPEGIRAGDEWMFVMKSLLSGFQGRDDDKRRLMSSITAGTRKGLLPRNMKEHLKDLLHGVEQDTCNELDGVLYLCVRLTKPTCGNNTVTEDEFTHVVLPYLAGKHLNSVLTHLVRKHRWAAVDRVLQHGVSDDMHNWAVEECSKYAHKDDFIAHVFPHFSDYQRDFMLVHLVTRGQWKAVNTVLHRGVRNVRHSWAVEECSKKAESDDFIRYVLPHCADDQLDSVLTHLVARGEWKAVDRVLHRVVNKEHHNWAVEECSKNAKSDDFIHYALSHCADDQLDSLLTHLVTRRHWKAVDKVLPAVVNEDFHRWAVEECSKKTTNDAFIKYILPHCADDQLDSVLTHLVTRGQWKAVDRVLHRGVSKERHRWAVEECCKKAYSDDFIEYALPHCADDQLDSVLTHLVEQGEWEAVDRVLHRGVSNNRHRWAVKECSKYAYHANFIEYALPHCADDQLNSVLTRLEKQGEWKAVDRVLHRVVNRERHRRAVEKCSKNATSDDFIKYALPHCADDQLDSVLTHLVEQGEWKAVDRVLHRGVSNELPNWAVEECSKNATSDNFMEYALSHCADDQLDSVLTHLVKRGEWKAVDRVLHRGVSKERHRWAVEECSKNTTSDDFKGHALSHCADDQLDSVLTHLVKRGEWKAVDRVLHRGVTRTTNEVNQKDVFLRYILPRDYAIVLPLLVEHGKLDLVGLVLDKVVASSLHQWVTGETRLPQGDEEASLNDVNTCQVDVIFTIRLFKTVLCVGKDGQAQRNQLPLTDDLYEVLYISLVHNVCLALCSDDNHLKHINDPVDSCVPPIYEKVHSCMKNITVGCSVEAIIDQWKKQDSKLPSEPLGISKHSSTNTFFQFLQQFNLYYRNRRGENDDDILLTMFAVLPLFPELQSVALRVMVRHKRWDVISHACLSRVWEQDRWQLLKAAVKQRQWSVVSKWADHTLYDDQRVWALNEALNDKQWDVALLLADHGLTDIELMQVRYRVAKYADWDVVLRMFERGGDVAEIRERLGRMREGKRIPENVKRNIARTHIDALNLETKMRGKKSLQDLRQCCQENNWTLVLYSLVRCPSKTSHHMALKAAVKKKAWHVVIQLVRLGMEKAKRNSFFSDMRDKAKRKSYFSDMRDKAKRKSYFSDMMDKAKRDFFFIRMMRRRQWGVCRALLEQGLSLQVCLDALPFLVEMNQWTLVARVIEQDVDDDVRQQVMQHAWKRREGSVVWLCIKSLPAPMSVKEREALFQRAFSCEIWQVIKPLIEEKDVTGIRHRDTALLEAIEQHQWDVVDHCQRHHADINMQDNDGHIPIHNAARKGDWEAVKELTVRDGDPNLLDSEGLSVLHRAIRAEQWDLVKLLIQFHGDIHQAARYTQDYPHDKRTPLHMLIDARQGEAINSTLMWCPEQHKGLNHKKETSLHAVCLSDCPDAMYYLVARKVNPLAVTKTDQSALVYAVLNNKCPQSMVAECIRLGFSTHQPRLSVLKRDLLRLHSVIMRRGYCHSEAAEELTSPMICSILRELPTVTCMLYESGACSNGELFRLYTTLHSFTDLDTEVGSILHLKADLGDPQYKTTKERIEVALPYLKVTATRPRRLECLCRLAISHRLNVRGRRHRDVDQLDISEAMKMYILFSDLTDPFC